MENDKGVRKFQIALAAMGVVFFGYVLAGWRGWSAPLFDSFCIALVSLAVGFSSSNVAEKVFTRKSANADPKP